ncbi:MAG TPA: ribonuclease III [candidate division Zixibacteria bacterium]|nr:ribonuclease III [candidate division Zixibacteria bacterium]
MGFLDALKQIFLPKKSKPRSVNLDKVQDIIGYRFNDISLLTLALTHRSYSSNSDSDESNERMEFVGDSVLGLVIAHQLFNDHPGWREGDLTKVKALLVNETTLAEIGKEIGLNQHIFLSPEEEKSGGHERPSIVSDAVESVIAAIYMDGGFEVARKFVLDQIYSRKADVRSDSSQRNYKGELLELVQGKGESMPRYDVASQTGPDHDKTFNVVVSINGRALGSGVGSSKKEAEQKAAAEALERLNEN